VGRAGPSGSRGDACGGEPRSPLPLGMGSMSQVALSLGIGMESIRAERGPGRSPADHRGVERATTRSSRTASWGRTPPPADGGLPASEESLKYLDILLRSGQALSKNSSHRSSNAIRQKKNPLSVRRLGGSSSFTQLVAGQLALYRWKPPRELDARAEFVNERVRSLTAHHLLSLP
jgi:hypothetical protein